MLTVFFLTGCIETTAPPDLGPPPLDSPYARARARCEQMVDEVQRTACLRSLDKQAASGPILWRIRLGLNRLRAIRSSGRLLHPHPPTLTRMKNFVSALAVSLAATFAMGAHADPAAKMVSGRLVNASGMTLYTFDKDVAGSGKSVCNSPCSSRWPPAMAAANARPEGDFSIVKRDDGGRQWAYKGKPLYLYGADDKAGDTNGDNVGDVWHIVK